ncbi:hypothetical protein PIB30_025890 [Stylosanthes scabra]|uniref:Uncharacterized protein n=1 Tax=Stylosanthes scabra TaxID=79078 RepID=A0ABU6YAH8_9FABA|nr:hypothetical protein [Stylosanthes scabra]
MTVMRSFRETTHCIGWYPMMLLQGPLSTQHRPVQVELVVSMDISAWRRDEKETISYSAERHGSLSEYVVSDSGLDEASCIHGVCQPETDIPE